MSERVLFYNFINSNYFINYFTPSYIVYVTTRGEIALNTPSLDPRCSLGPPQYSNLSCSYSQ